jgi:hypothetical protein
MLFTHNFSRGTGILPVCFVRHFRRYCFSVRTGKMPVPLNKKAPTHDEKGRQNGCALLIFPKPMMLELELAPVIETKVQSVAVVSSGHSLDHSL